MKILVFSPGYVGKKIVTGLQNAGHDIESIKVEITDLNAVHAALDASHPDAVLNGAGRRGIPNVDWCETNQISTMRSNTIGALILAQACFEKNIHMVHLGTGCVFYGESPDPAGWKESDHANPQAVYSRTKYAADLILTELPNVAIVRFRMPIDSEPTPENLINKLVKYPKIIDVRNSVTVLDDLVTAVVGIIEKRGVGVFHAVNPGVMAHRDLMKLYTEIVDPNHISDWITADALVSTGLAKRIRSNNIMQNIRLRELGIELRPIDIALRDVMEKYARAVHSV